MLRHTRLPFRRLLRSASPLTSEAASHLPPPRPTETCHVTPSESDHESSFHTNAGPIPCALFAPQVASAASAASPIIFPREGPGLNYALNWALASAGVTPSGAAHRNLKPSALASDFSAKPLKKTSGAKLVTVGKGPNSISPQQFEKLLKAVTAHLSSTSPLFVHDGAVGSSSAFDARVRLVSDSPSLTSSLASVLTPTPTTTISAASFPITVYAASSFSAGTYGKEGAVVVDTTGGRILLLSSASSDLSLVKSALSASASDSILSRGGVPLPGWLISVKGSNAVVVAPPSSLITSALGKAAVSPDAGVVFSPLGVARFFKLPAASSAPNLYKLPSALILLTTDSSAGIPAISKLSPQQAAFYFLAGFDGTSFLPCYSSPSLSPPNPLALAKSLSVALAASSTNAYLVNASTEKELEKLVVAAVTGALPAAKQDASASATETLKARFDDFFASSFPELPPEISH